MERWSDADHHFEEALAINERIGARPWLAHTQDDCGQMLLKRGEIERASALIATALNTYRALGMDGCAESAQALINEFTATA